MTARDCTDVYRCKVLDGQLPSFSPREMRISEKYDIKPFKSKSDLTDDDTLDLIQEMINTSSIDKSRLTQRIPRRIKTTRAERYAKR